MTVSADQLRHLHRLHQQLADVRGRLKRGPLQIKAGEAKLEQQTKEADEAKEIAKRNKMTSDDKELSLKEREGRIVDIKVKLNSASSNKEYQAFVEQIAADEQANSVLSDEILELFEKQTELEEVLKGKQTKQSDGETDLKKLKERVASEKESLETDLVRLEKELAEVEGKLPNDFKVDYDRVVNARGEDAIAPLEGEVCGGCYTTVTPQTFDQLKMGKPIFCKFCGCLLYIPEEES